MQNILNALVVLIALQHVLFMILEMFFWTKPLGRQVFGLDSEFAEKSKTLASNQGLYNGFLAAGLLWGMLSPLPESAASIKVFFLACVLVAGLYGGFTVGRKILFIQALPAGLALLFALLAG